MADVDVGEGQAAKPRWYGRDFYVTIGDRSWEEAERHGFGLRRGRILLVEAA